MGVIRYVSTGRQAPAVKVNASMNNGGSWQNRDLLPGQSYPIPKNCTTLLIYNIPYDPSGDYEIRNGQVARKR